MRLPKSLRKMNTANFFDFRKASFHNPTFNFYTNDAPNTTRRKSGTRARSTQQGLTKLYDAYLNGDQLASWPRSINHYIKLTASDKNVWFKAIQLIYALDAMKRKFIRRPTPIPLQDHTTLSYACLAVQDYVQTIIYENSDAVLTNPLVPIILRNLAVNLGKAVSRFILDCQIKDPTWSACHSDNEP